MHPLVPKSKPQQESGLSVAADSDTSISENIPLFSELSPHPKGAHKLASDHWEEEPCSPCAAGAGSEGDVCRSCQNFKLTLHLNVIFSGNSATSSSPHLVQPGLFLFLSCTL